MLSSQPYHAKTPKCHHLSHLVHEQTIFHFVHISNSSSSTTLTIMTTHNLTRRVAITLITLLQSAHYILVVLDAYDPHSRWLKARNPRWMTILVHLFEGFFIASSSYRLVEHNVNAKVVRHVTISGSRIDRFLWYVAAWSAALVMNDARGDAGGLMTLAQLVMCDVIWLWAMFSKNVDFFERKEVVEERQDGDEEEKTGGNEGEVVEEKREEKKMEA